VCVSKTCCRMDSWLSSYQARIGLERLEKLEHIQRAHLQSIPFENLSILAGEAIQLTPQHLLDKLVHRKRGGYCFEQNSFMAESLRRLGYEVTTLAARVRRGVTELRPHTHMLLSVRDQGQDFLVDVGFGGEGPAAPLPLCEGSWPAATGVEHSLRREDDLWVLACRHDGGMWLDLYAFEDRPHHAVDYLMYNHFTETFPGSLFVNSMLVSLHLADGYQVLFDGSLKLRQAGRTRLQRLANRSEVEASLARDFNIEVPPLKSCPISA
jgi:N-hydroxyarylamine O-acetyltransferase